MTQENKQLQAVLFDLDGTLLPMDQEVFTKAYFSSLTAKVAPYGYDPKSLMRNIWAGTEAMIRNDGHASNEEIFWEHFCTSYGEDARRDEPLFDAFYRNEFEQVRTSCGFSPEAKQCVASAKALGVPVLLATNPLFPRPATEARIRWAGLALDDFAFITTYENSRFCKPNLDYYRDILSSHALRAEQCLMVGNDVDEDMIASELGMQVFLLTDCLINRSGRPTDHIPQGSFPDLIRFLTRYL